ncbi:MAG: VOC family protein [Candidatus Krumholzibacteria bacterium]|nr:VOC family protein [Candidatus Krumholzibacteria bacterium]
MVDQIDHVELFVPDRYQAAEWYRQVLGCEVVAEYEAWAQDRRGPLMISPDSGSTKLALFEGESQGSRPTSGFHLVAFRVDGAGFVHFVESAVKIPLKDHKGEPVTAASVVDHQKAFSIYFCDPYGHRLEVTTYDYEWTKKTLQAGAR